ncbi:MAG: preprotein translocase subunit YajC [Planctomycetes bacterium]|nr:preprotein translocase subunit YajC [Planctomycetota bacterium]
MDMMWILAAAGDGSSQEEGGVITSDDAEGQAFETATGQEGDAGQEAPAGEPTPPPPSYQPFIMIGLMVVVMYMLLFRGPRKKQKEQQNMVQSLQRNDRVRTIGGILGTIVDVRDDEIIVKVDESNNTKMRFAPSAISTVLSDDRA